MRFCVAAAKMGAEYSVEVAEGAPPRRLLHWLAAYAPDWQAPEGAAAGPPPVGVLDALLAPCRAWWCAASNSDDAERSAFDELAAAFESRRRVRALVVVMLPFLYGDRRPLEERAWGADGVVEAAVRTLIRNLATGGFVVRMAASCLRDREERAGPPPPPPSGPCPCVLASGRACSVPCQIRTFWRVYGEAGRLSAVDERFVDATVRRFQEVSEAWAGEEFLSSEREWFGTELWRREGGGGRDGYTPRLVGGRARSECPLRPCAACAAWASGA